MALGETIYSRMTSYSATAALIGNRCYPVILPQDPQLPATTYQEFGSYTSAGRGHLAEVRVQVTAWATTYAAANTLAAAIKAALRQYQNKSASPVLLSMAEENQFDIFEPETMLYGIAVDFTAYIVE